MSSGGTYMCLAIGYADASAMITSTIANILPMVPGLSPRPARAAVHTNSAQLPFRANCEWSCQCRSVGLGFEEKVNGLGFAAGDGDFLRLLAIRLVPRSDGVLARGQIGKLEVSTLGGDRVVRILQHRERSVHPRMNVALYGDKLRLVVFVHDRRRSRWMRFVPLAVDLGQRTDVV